MTLSSIRKALSSARKVAQGARGCRREEAGGTSIEVALEVHGDWRVENRDRFFGKIVSPDLVERGFMTRYLQHLTMGEILELVPETADFFRFAFVRNPYDRLVSTYFNADPDLLRRAREQGIELEGLSFPRFVQAIDGLEHVHLRPQSDFLLDAEGRHGVEFVGRFERLREDFGEVCRRLGVRSRLPHRNRSQRRQSYRRMYDGTCRRFVEERYARDLEAFSYDY